MLTDPQEPLFLQVKIKIKSFSKDACWILWEMRLQNFTLKKQWSYLNTVTVELPEHLIFKNSELKRLFSLKKTNNLIPQKYVKLCAKSTD